MRKLIAFVCTFTAIMLCLLTLAAKPTKSPPGKSPPGQTGTSNGGGPASTAAATSSTGFVLTPDPPCPSTPPDACTKWTTVLTTTIKNPTADDDLFIDVSQVDALTTMNATSSATPTLVSTGDAKLEMQVLVDGIPATPGPIVFDELLTTLTSNLQTFLSLNCTQTTVQNVVVTTSCVCTSSTNPALAAVSCAPTPAPLPTGYDTRTCTTTSNPDPDVVTTCSLVPGANQSLATVLGETIGHSYDFFAPGVGGMGNTHIVQVQERLHLTSASAGTAQVVIGPTTLKVEAVNLK